MNIAILSTTKLPRFLGEDHPDEKALFAEDDVLAKALGARGVEARRVAWREGDDWGRFDLVLVRSTWDYIDDLPGFLKVLGEIEAAGCRLVNPRATIEWNIDKRYLAGLREAGVPTVPTKFLVPGEETRGIIEELGDPPGGTIVKPTVGVGAFGTTRLADGEALARWLDENEIASPHMLQPFVESVVTEGEWSFVFGGGRFLYTALKQPQAGDFRVQVMYGARTVAMEPAASDLERATACLEALPVPVELARIDMARLADGKLALMEAELIEPQLFFFDVPEAGERVADAVLSLPRMTAIDDGRGAIV